MNNNIALFTGRFQPPSIGHVAMVQAILEQWNELVIGVVDVNLDTSDNFDQRWLPHLAATKIGFSSQNYVFTAHEVLRMWDAWIDAECLRRRVVSRAVPRVYLETFSIRHPSEAYDLVYPTVRANGFEVEHLRKRLFPELLKRKVYYLEPSFQLHNSEIKSLVKAGREWKEFIPRGAYEVFRSIDGARRIAEASQFR